MMKSDHVTDDDTPFSAKRYFAHLILWSTALAFALIAAVVVVVAASRLPDAGEAFDLWAVAIGTPVTLLAAYGLWRTMPDFTMGEPHTPRGNRMRRLIAAIVFVGIAISLPINLADSGQGGKLLWGNGPMPQTPALIAVVMWSLSIPVVMVAGRRVADEHTRAAGDFGMMVGFQTFAYIAPMWWMGWRGGFLPQPDVMILFIVAGALSAGANLWKRFA